MMGMRKRRLTFFLCPVGSLMPQSFEFKPTGHEERIQSLEVKVDAMGEDVHVLKEERKKTKHS